MNKNKEKTYSYLVTHITNYRCTATIVNITLYTNATHLSSDQCTAISIHKNATETESDQCTAINPRASS